MVVKKQNNKKEDTDMEMCYDGALVMPSSYAVMDNDEMTYVEGGWFSWSQVKKFGSAVVAICTPVTAVVSMINQVIKFGATIKGMTETAFATAVAKKVSATVGKIVAWITKYAGAIACVVGTVLGLIGGWALGSYIGKRIFAGR